MSSVIVIGGGPAGASFATRMAQLGCEVTLVEAQAFPRTALGESLTPGVRTLLEATGAWRRVAAEGFPAARNVHVIWEEDSILRLKGGSQGMIVDRGRFDQLLLAHAAANGVRVLQPAIVMAQHEAADGWEIVVRHAGVSESIRADFLADARGRRNPGRRRAFGTRTLAIFAYWQPRNPPPHASVAACEQGWVWGVPLPDGRVNAQVFTDPQTLRGMPGTLEERYRQLIASSPLGRMLDGGRLAGPVQAIDATAAMAEEAVSGRVIRLGDAALVLDPISSSGVQKALQTALSGAIVANTLLRKPALEAPARAFYRDSLASAAARHAGWAGGHYAAAARTRFHAFWAARAGTPPSQLPEEHPVSLHETVALAPETGFIACPCLGAEFVEVRQALVHPALEEPLVFLAGLPIAPLLPLPKAATLAEIAQGWAGLMPAGTALRMAQWLRRKGILRPVSGMEAAA